jgi:hypothetical protein
MDAGAIFFSSNIFSLLRWSSWSVSCCWSCYRAAFWCFFNFSFCPEVSINSFVTSAMHHLVCSVCINMANYRLHCYSITFFCFKSNPLLLLAILMLLCLNQPLQLLGLSLHNLHLLLTTLQFQLLYWFPGDGTFISKIMFYYFKLWILSFKLCSNNLYFLKTIF